MRFRSTRYPSIKQHRWLYILLATSLLISIGVVSAMQTETAQSSHIYIGSDGKLVYVPYENGDTIPDFSNAGYRGGGVQIPNVEVKKVVEPIAGDDGANIQTAIDEVSALEPNANGFRGAVLLKAGTYDIAASISIKTSGIVLRGEGEGSDGTVLKATGTSRRALINASGVGNRTETPGTKQLLTDTYVPVGSKSFNVADASGYAVGDQILVVRTPNQEWIDYSGTDACSTIGTSYDTSDVDNSTCLSSTAWTPSSRIMRYERRITGINENRITIDAPVVESIQSEFGGGYVAKFTFPGRIKEIGIEYLRSESYFASDTDEEHAVRMIALSNVENAWVRNAVSVYFEQGTVTVNGGAKYVTVQDSSSLDHKSQITGGRRYPFNLDDSSFVLIMRCYARTGRHDYVTGSNTPGPNVFLDNVAEQSYSELGPHHRWATGSLFDLIKHVSYNGSQIIGTYNRGNSGTGHGWSGAYQLFWNPIGDTHRVSSPPGARNWSIGAQMARRSGTGEFESYGIPVIPGSLYLQQLRERLGDSAINNIGYSVVLPTPGSRSTPTPTPTPTDPSTHYEAETIPFVTTEGRTNTPTADSQASGGIWMGLNASGVGDYVEYTLSNVPAGKYDFKFRYKFHNRNRGIAQLSLDGTNLGNPIDQSISPGGNFTEINFGEIIFATDGDHKVRLTVTGKNPNAILYNLNADRFSLAPNKIPPAIMTPDSITREATYPTGTIVHYAASANDDKDGPVPVYFNIPSGSAFPIGTTIITATATDTVGNVGKKSFAITVTDRTAPQIKKLTASPNVLWPPNHKMIPVKIIPDVFDNGDASPSFQVISITSNEPENGEGDGNTSPDWEIVGPLEIKLRAERSGEGAGRIYTIIIECIDASGNSSRGTVTVTVPKNKS